MGGQEVIPEGFPEEVMPGVVVQGCRGVSWRVQAELAVDSLRVHSLPSALSCPAPQESNTSVPPEGNWEKQALCHPGLAQQPHSRKPEAT